MAFKPALTYCKESDLTPIDLSEGTHHMRKIGTSNDWVVNKLEVSRLEALR